MPIDFGESKINSFAALKPKKSTYTARPYKIQNSYKMYLPKDFINAFNTNKGDIVYITYNETEDILHLEPPLSVENFPFIKKLRIQGAGFSTRYIILPKKLITRYSEKMVKVVLTQIDTTKMFKLLFYKE